MTKTTHLILAILVLISQISPSYGAPQVPCLFIFGDSLSDAGNNNFLLTGARANFLPYGIDFPKGPTGRFCNGRTTIDLVGDLLGLPGYIPPFQSGRVLLGDMSKGVNYASGSAGVFRETGKQVGDNVHMDKQLDQHKQVLAKLGSRVQPNKCLYSVYVGSNDWMMNYYSGGPARLKYPIPQIFADAIIKKLTGQIDRLHGMGARKFVMFGMSPLGCLPSMSEIVGHCSQYINQKLSMYNLKLKALVDTLNSKYSDSKFIWINSMDIITKDLKGLGMKVNYVPCCGPYQPACLPLMKPCPNRKNHAYWDNAHTTEEANKMLAGRAVHAKGPNDAYPMDITGLIKA